MQTGREQPAVEVRGFLETINETDPEGVIWSLRDPGLPDGENILGLESGDELRVLDDSGCILWEGVVQLGRLIGRPTRSPTEDPYEEEAPGMRLHGMPNGVDPKTWQRMFDEGRRAILRRGPPNPWDRSPHPFSGSTEGLRARLAALPRAQAEKLFKDALAPWFWFHLGDEWRSLAQSWGFGQVETLQLLAHTSPEQMRACANYIMQGGDTLPPFLLERLGLLYGLNAALLWGLPDVASRAAWLRAENARLYGGSPLVLLLGGGMEEIYMVLNAAHACLDGVDAKVRASDEQRRHRETVEALDMERRRLQARVLSYLERVDDTILAQAANVFGSKEGAAEWLMQPAMALNQNRPIELLGTAEGREQVDRLLTRLQYGVYT